MRLQLARLLRRPTLSLSPRLSLLHCFIFIFYGLQHFYHFFPSLLSIFPISRKLYLVQIRFPVLSSRTVSPCLFRSMLFLLPQHFCKLSHWFFHCYCDSRILFSDPFGFHMYLISSLKSSYIFDPFSTSLYSPASTLMVREPLSSATFRIFPHHASPLRIVPPRCSEKVRSLLSSHFLAQPFSHSAFPLPSPIIIRDFSGLDPYL